MEGRKGCCGGAPAGCCKQRRPAAANTVANGALRPRQQHRIAARARHAIKHSERPGRAAENLGKYIRGDIISYQGSYLSCGNQAQTPDTVAGTVT